MKKGSSDMLQTLREQNPTLPLFSVFEAEFRTYGRVLEGIDVSPYVDYLREKTEIPTEGNVYVAADKGLEALPIHEWVQHALFGGMAVQAGYCNGHSDQLNALEYHKCSEMNVAATDFVLLLAHINDIHQNQIHSSRVKGFLVPANTSIEIFSTTLHFAPSQVTKAGFQCLVVLTNETNTPIELPKSAQTDEEKLLFMKNKWLIAHADSPSAKNGAFVGIEGNNIKLISS